MFSYNNSILLASVISAAQSLYTSCTETNTRHGEVHNSLFWETIKTLKTTETTDRMLLLLLLLQVQIVHIVQKYNTKHGSHS